MKWMLRASVPHSFPSRPRRLRKPTPTAPKCLATWTPRSKTREQRLRVSVLHLMATGDFLCLPELITAVLLIVFEFLWIHSVSSYACLISWFAYASRANVRSNSRMFRPDHAPLLKRALESNWSQREGVQQARDPLWWSYYVHCAFIGFQASAISGLTRADIQKNPRARHLSCSVTSASTSERDHCGRIAHCQDRGQPTKARTALRHYPGLNQLTASHTDMQHRQ